jgi:hypothetical protein
MKVPSVQVMKALTIKEPWISLILSGKKTWELRSRDTRVRGRIALIRKGSGTVVGVADLTATLPNLSRSDLKTNVAKHQVPQREIGLDFRWNVAWVLEGARPLREPVPYQHPPGAVIWVNLPPEVAAAVQRASRNPG